MVRKAKRPELVAWIALSWLVPCPHLMFAAEPPPEVLSDLKSEEFQTRERAEAALVEWGRGQPGEAMEELYRQSRVADEPEVRERCLSVLRELVIDEYLKDGEGYIGIQMRDELARVPGDAIPRGAIRVVDVMPDSAAARSGLRVNDLIVALDGEIWRDEAGSGPFMKRIRQMKPKSKITLKLLRDGELIDQAVVLGRRPLVADNPLFMDQPGVREATERAAKDAYFARWLERRKGRD